MLCYAGYWRRRQSRRRAETWEQIVAKFRPNTEWGFDGISRKYLYDETITATTADIWQRIDGPRGLWAMYTNAGVLVQLADYAMQHGQDVPEELIEGLRSDGFQIRISVLLALAQYGLHRSNISFNVNAHRAAKAYGTMLSHATGIFQEHATLYFPRYLEVM